MSIYDLKPKFQNLLRPTTTKLADKGVTANQVTLVACGISVVLGLLLTLLRDYSFFFILIPIWLFVRMALNAIDGMLAREFNQKTRLGGYLNEITDIVSDAALYLPFALIAPFSPWQIGLIIWLSALTEFCGVLGQVQGQTRRYDGPMGKSDRAFLFGALGLAYCLLGELPSWLYWAGWALILLLVATCVKRVYKGLQETPSNLPRTFEPSQTVTSATEEVAVQSADKAEKNADQQPSHLSDKENPNAS